MADFDIFPTAGVSPAGEVTEFVVGLNDPLMVGQMTSAGVLTTSRPLQSKALVGALALAGVLALTLTAPQQNFQRSFAGSLAPAGQLTLRRPAQSVELSGGITPQSAVNIISEQRYITLSGSITPTGPNSRKFIKVLKGKKFQIGPRGSISMAGATTKQPSGHQGQVGHGVGPTGQVQLVLASTNSEASLAGDVTSAGVLTLTPSVDPFVIILEGGINLGQHEVGGVVVPAGQLGLITSGDQEQELFLNNDLFMSGDVQVLAIGDPLPNSIVTGRELMLFGELTINTDFVLGGDGSLGGEIVPRGVVGLLLGKLECVTVYRCIEISRPAFNCVDVCAPPVPEIPPVVQEEIALEGVITFAGEVENEILGIDALAGSIAPSGEVTFRIVFDWFKQAWFSGTDITNNLLRWDGSFSFGPFHTVGVHAGHWGASYFISPDYRVRVKVFIPASGSVSGYNGPTARTPLSAGFNNWAAYRWVAAGTNIILQCLPGPDGNVFSWQQSVAIEESWKGTEVELMIEVEGSSIRGYVNGVLKSQRTDTTFTLAGRPGLIAAAAPAADAYVTGPWHMDSMNYSPPFYMHDTLEEVGPKSLETHVPTG
jgi:hypothetical protein